MSRVYPRRHHFFKMLALVSLIAHASVTHVASGRPSETRTCADAHTPPNTCIKPGTCTPPVTPYSAVARGPQPGLQWDFSGGFCGSFSVQQGALSQGAWISQDKVRKSNKDQGGIEHNMHGDTTVGFEVMPSNVKFTADHLKLVSEEWDYRQPSPQAAAWKAWAKKHLVQRHPIVFFPMCKGDQHVCYPGSCPNGGACDHVESMYGIFSEHPLDDLTVYDTDVVVHTSNQDCYPYYRQMVTLEDTTAMESNCASAEPGWGRNEMYPCIDSSVTYGLAVTGLAVNGTAGTTSLVVDVKYEPNVREGDSPMAVNGNVTVTGLAVGGSYTIYRYVGTETLPSNAGAQFRARMMSTANMSKPVTADSEGEARWLNMPTFSSDEAVYHFAVAN